MVQRWPSRAPLHQFLGVYEENRHGMSWAASLGVFSTGVKDVVGIPPVCLFKKWSRGLMFKKISLGWRGKGIYRIVNMTDMPCT